MRNLKKNLDGPTKRDTNIRMSTKEGEPVWVQKLKRLAANTPGGINYRRISMAAGISHNRLSGNMREGRVFAANTAMRIARALDISGEYLWDDAVRICDSPPRYGQGLVPRDIPVEALARLLAMLPPASLIPATAPPPAAAPGARTQEPHHGKPGHKKKKP